MHHKLRNVIIGGAAFAAAAIPAASAFGASTASLADPVLDTVRKGSSWTICTGEHAAGGEVGGCGPVLGGAQRDGEDAGPVEDIPARVRKGSAWTACKAEAFPDKFPLLGSGNDGCGQPT